MKRYIVLLLMCFALLSFAGCDTPVERTKNYLEIYSDFLSYSLGEYEVINESTENHYRRISSQPITYTRWTLQYTRHDGEVKTFSFDNQFDNGLGEDYYMGQSLVWAAGSIWLEDIEQEIISHYFTPEEIGFFTPTSQTQLLINPQLQRDSTAKTYSDMLNPQSGLQLHSIILSELLKDWDIIFMVDVTTKDADNHLDILNRFNAMIRALSEFSGHDRIMVDFRASNEDRIIDGTSFFGYYDKGTDVFNVTYRQHN